MALCGLRDVQTVDAHILAREPEVFPPLPRADRRPMRSAAE